METARRAHGLRVREYGGKMSPLDYYNIDEVKLLERSGEPASQQQPDSDRRSADDQAGDSNRALWIVGVVFVTHYAIFYLVMELCLRRLGH
jgi:hypothetical protein